MPAERLSYQQILILAEGPIGSGIRILGPVEGPIIAARDLSYPQRSFVTVEGLINSVGRASY